MSKSNGHKGGIIMNVSSIAGVKAAHCMPVYCASKFGVIGYTKALSPFSEPMGIKFIVVCPGITITTLAKTMGDHFYRPELIPVDAEKLLNRIPRQRYVVNPNYEFTGNGFVQFFSPCVFRDWSRCSAEECAALMVGILEKSDDTVVWVIKENECKPAIFAEPY